MRTFQDMCAVLLQKTLSGSKSLLSKSFNLGLSRGQR